jgi:protocatechuate 3,4-dioxygenase, alpha subunit
VTDSSTKLGQTPSQTIGPYFAYGLVPEQYGYRFTGIASGTVAARDEPGQHIRIEGRVLDGAGEPVFDALIEIWQADATGRYAHAVDPRGSNYGFRGFGRIGTGTDPEKRFVFDTVKPGSVDGRQAPHINMTVMMRGVLMHAFTRVYFSDEAVANAADPVLLEVPSDRRNTLIAQRAETPAGPVYRFDVHMQGANETVFFDV